MNYNNKYFKYKNKYLKYGGSDDKSHIENAIYPGNFTNITSCGKCSICLEESDEIDIITECNHCFHEKCIILIKNNQCPNCRKTIDMYLHIEPNSNTNSKNDQLFDNIKNSEELLVNQINILNKKKSSMYDLLSKVNDDIQQKNEKITSRLNLKKSLNKYYYLNSRLNTIKLNNIEEELKLLNHNIAYLEERLLNILSYIDYIKLTIFIIPTLTIRLQKLSNFVNTQLKKYKFNIKNITLLGEYNISNNIVWYYELNIKDFMLINQNRQQLFINDINLLT